MVMFSNNLARMEYRHFQFKQKMAWGELRFRFLMLGLDMAKTEEEKEKAKQRVLSFLKEE